MMIICFHCTSPWKWTTCGIACCTRKQKWNQHREEDAHTCTSELVRHAKGDRKSTISVVFQYYCVIQVAVTVCTTSRMKWWSEHTCHIHSRTENKANVHPHCRFVKPPGSEP